MFHFQATFFLMILIMIWITSNRSSWYFDSTSWQPISRIAVVSRPSRALRLARRDHRHDFVKPQNNIIKRSAFYLHNNLLSFMMPLPFNKTLDLTLLKLVRENPIIYNCKDPKYLDFDTREVVWQKIGDILNRPPQVAKQRWINIRDMMRRKIRDRLRNPNHRSYNYKYEEEMAFMLPYFKETTSNPNDEYSDFFDDPTCEVLPTEFTEQTDFNQPDHKDIKPTITYKKRSEDFGNESRNEFSQELNPRDPIDVFLITIGSTLRKFSPYYLNQAKSKIFQVVQDYELQQIVDKDQPSNSDNR